jgi:hypothetical protein
VFSGFGRRYDRILSKRDARDEDVANESDQGVEIAAASAVPEVENTGYEWGGHTDSHRSFDGWFSSHFDGFDFG